MLSILLVDDEPSIRLSVGDALTDAGLLTRTTGEKKVFIVASKQVKA